MFESYEQILKDLEDLRDDTVLDKNEIFQEDFWDMRFCERELPDDFFDILGESFNEDKCVKLADANYIVGGVETSRLHYMDYTSGEVHVGPKESTPLKYVIHHDEEIVKPVMSWFIETDVLQKKKDFPMVEIARPIIDRSKVRPERHYVVQSAFMTKGYYLYNPTVLESKHCGVFGGMVADNPRTSAEEDYDKQKIFLSFKDASVGMEDYVAMQFNPYTPFSIRYIKTIEIKDYVATGKYEYGGREYFFRYDLKDKRYRIHSMEWQAMIGSNIDAYVPYDLVSDHDFIKVFDFFGSKDIDYSEFRDNVNRFSSFFIEPLMSDRVPEKPYSFIGPWEGKLQYGVGKEFVLPYLGDRIIDQTSQEDMEYEEVTHLTKFTYKFLQIRKFCNQCYDRKSYGSVNECECDKGGKYRRVTYQYTSDFYYSRKPDRVFVKMRSGQYRFHVFKMRMKNHYTNGKYSLVYSPCYVTLLDAIRLYAHDEDFKEMLPLTVVNLNASRVNITTEVADDCFEDYLQLVSEQFVQDGVIVMRVDKEGIPVEEFKKICVYEEGLTFFIVKCAQEDLCDIMRAFKRIGVQPTFL